MMYESAILSQYEMLPENYKQEVDDFIEFLLLKVNRDKAEKKPLKRNGLGSLKGLIKMADDFDSL